MPYSAEISRANPACFIILLDQSGSMSDPFGGEEQGIKAEGVARAINKLIQDLIIRCTKDDQVLRYFALGIIGYGAGVQPVFGGALAGQPMVWIDDINNNPLRVDTVTKKVPDGAGGLVDTTASMTVWFDPVANNGTPMTQAFQFALSLVQSWANEHPQSFPPIVIHISDGESTDGDPTAVVDQIKAVQMADGSPLVMNLHISSTSAARIAFPESDTGLPDQYAKMMFGMSSELPGSMREAASQFNYKLGMRSRGFVFNGKLSDVIGFLNIGTRSSAR